MAIPLWMQIVAENRMGGSRIAPQGAQPRTYRGDYNTTAVGARGVKRKSRGGKRRSEDYADTPEGQIEKFKDQGMSDAQIDKLMKGERGNEFSPLSPGDWVDKLGDVGGGVLKALDVPRSYAFSGAIELSDALVGLQNKLGLDADPVKGGDNLRQTGVSWRDFIENANNQVGMADVLQDEDELFGQELNDTAKTAISIGTDVASDPLNYVGVGLADEPATIARALSKQDTINRVADLKNLDAQAAKQLAERAAVEVRQKGITSLKDPDLMEAIGRINEGGLRLKVPGTGAVGRLTRLDKVLEKVSGSALPRSVSIAPAGTRVGDAAQALAQGTRKFSGLNAALKASAPLAEKGLSGGKGVARAAIRSADLDDPSEVSKAVRAIWTVTKEPEARDLAKRFETDLLKQLKPLLKAAKDTGVKGRDLWHAVGGDADAVGRVGVPLTEEFRKFFDAARIGANDAAGREFIKMVDYYTPRFLSDEARATFAKAFKNDGIRGVADAAGRQYKAGDVMFGQELMDPSVAGTSIEKQIEDILADQDQRNLVNWFKDDAYSVFPQYVRSVSRQLGREYFGNEMKALGIGGDLWREDLTKPIRDVPSDPLSIPKNSSRRQRRIIKEVREAEQIVMDYGAATRKAKELDWEDLHAKAKEVGREWEPAAYNTLNELSRQLGMQMAQYGSNTALPVDVVQSLMPDVSKMGSANFPKLMALHDRVLSMWKKAALLTPGYHWRNTFGGIYMNWLGGVDEGRYKQLAQLALHDRKGTLDAAKIDDNLKDAYLEAKRLGVFSQSQSMKEIENVSEKIPLSPVRGSRRVGNVVESELRGAMFIDEFVKNGGDGSEAFAKTLKYHFDYEDLSQLETSLRRVIPFYTWTRRSVPLMLEQVVRNPGKINRYFTIKRDVEKLTPDSGLTPGYFDRNFAVRLPWENGGGNLFAMPDLPLMSLVDASESSNLLGSLSPVVKTPMELWAGKQFFKDIPINDKAVPIPPYLKWLEQPLRALTLVQDGPDGPVMTERSAYIMTQFLPQLGQARRIFPSEDRYKDRRMSSVLSFMLGIGLRTNTVDEQTNELKRRYFSYEDEVQRNEDLGFGAYVDEDGEERQSADVPRALAYGTP